MTKTQLREELRARRIFNSYGFYGLMPYIQRMAGDDWHLAAWKVNQRDIDLNDGKGHWQNRNSKVFVINGRADVMPRLAEALAWATKRFGFTEWVIGPFGDRGPAEWTDKRIKWLLTQPKTYVDPALPGQAP